MSEEKENNIKELEKKLGEIRKVVYWNIKKYGQFDLTLNDGTFIFGHNAEFDWFYGEPRIWVEDALYGVYAIVPIKSIKWIGLDPEVPEGDKNE